jgi:serine/threonine-protein kinase
MAPEQITQGQTTAATDIFAVGAVLYQLLASMKPFDAPTLQNLLFKIITEKPRPISELTPTVPQSLERIVMKALEKDPPARYASALDMANDLTRERAKLSGPAYPASVSLSASVADAIEQSRKTSQKRSQRVMIIGGAALAAAIAIAIFRGPLSRSSAPQPAVDTAATVVHTDVAHGTGAMIGVITQAPTQSAESPPAVSAAPPTPARSTPQRAQTTEKPRVTTRDTRTVPTPAKPPPKANQASVTKQTPATVPLVVSQPPVTTLRQDPLPSAPVVEAPRQALKQETTVAAPSAPNPADIGQTVQAYARAIESRDISAIRRVYPGLTADQQRGFEQFFQSTRSLNVTFRVTNVEASGSSADARLVGSYEYVTTAGQSQRQPVNFAATLRHDGGQWRLVSVR